MKKEKDPTEIYAAIATKMRKDKITKYVMDAIDPSGYDVVCENDKEKLQFLINTFNAEYNHDYNLRRLGSVQKVFEEWLMGVPSCFNIDFYNHKIIALGREWDILPPLAMPGKVHAAKEDQFLQTWYARIYMRVKQLCYKHKIEIR